MNKYSYNLEAKNLKGEWFALFGTVGLEYGRGYLDHQRHAPGPRLAIRRVRSDGKVMDEASELSDASIGMVAGWPSAEQYRRAAARCIEAAKKIELTQLGVTSDLLEGPTTYASSEIALKALRPQLSTGKVFGLRFNYADGSSYRCGSWAVPHDSQHDELERVGNDIGWTIVYEMAKQPTKTVVSVDVLPWPIQEV